MAYEVNGDAATFTADTALVAHRLVEVKAASTTTPPEVNYTDGDADGDQAVVGVTVEAAAEDASVAVRLLNRGGIVKVTSAVTDITVGQKLYPAASGKITNVATADSFVGIALETATADGDVISMLPSLQVLNSGS